MEPPLPQRTSLSVGSRTQHSPPGALPPPSGVTNIPFFDDEVEVGVIGSSSIESAFIIVEAVNQRENNSYRTMSDTVED